MSSPGPSYEIRATTIAEVRDLFARFHPYKGAGNCAVYAFAVIEDEKPVVAYLWQPPPPGAAKSVFKELPAGVLALSRMVATPRDERRLQHISKPLRWQMKNLIDRVRWPVCITYSDESVGHQPPCFGPDLSKPEQTDCECKGPFHTGHVYKCSGWQKTKRRKAPTYTTSDGRRISSYSDGGHMKHLPEGVVKGSAWIQRWEQWADGERESLVSAFNSAWERVPVLGKKWKSGLQAYTYERKL